MQPIFETPSRFEREAKWRDPMGGQPPPENGVLKAGKNGGYRERRPEFREAKAMVKVSLSHKPQRADAPWAVCQPETGHHA